jgi:hypothetical protein
MMPWGETIADYIGKKQDRKSKNRDAMWAKLMEAANMGKDIWTTLSGRQYATGEREAAQGYGTNERLAAAANSASEAAKGRGFQAEQGLYDKAFNAQQAELDRQLNRDLESSRAAREMGDKSEKRMSFLADWTQRAYQLALSNPVFLDETGQFNMAKKEELRNFLYSQVDKLPQLKPEEVMWAKQSFDGYVDSWGSGAGAIGQKGAVQTPAFNPPAEAKPTKPAFADITSLAQKLVEARRVASGDPESKRLLD